MIRFVLIAAVKSPTAIATAQSDLPSIDVNERLTPQAALDDQDTTVFAPNGNGAVELRNLDQVDAYKALGFSEEDLVFKVNLIARPELPGEVRQVDLADIPVTPVLTAPD